MMKTVLAASAAALMLAGAAQAQVTVSTTVPGSEVLIDNFNNGSSSLAAGYTLSPNTSQTSAPYSTGIFTSSISGIALEPTGDTSGYYAVLANDSPATLTASTPITSLSLEIGSLDPYNTISFYAPGGALVGSLTGTQISAATGVADNDATTGNFYFNFGGADVSAVTFASSQNSFEFDNLAVTAAPEPATWGLMIAGVAMAGLGLRSRRRTALVAA